MVGQAERRQSALFGMLNELGRREASIRRYAVGVEIDRALVVHRFAASLALGSRGTVEEA
jgi:hypothetical protein